VYTQLVAGSGANQDRDESSDAAPLVDGDAAQPSPSVVDSDVAQDVHAEVNAKEDGYSVGVPGPLTRIFVLANRGVANLIQDLILVSCAARLTERPYVGGCVYVHIAGTVISVGTVERFSGVFRHWWSPSFWPILVQFSTVKVRGSHSTRQPTQWRIPPTPTAENFFLEKILARRISCNR